METKKALSFQHLILNVHINQIFKYDSTSIIQIYYYSSLSHVNKYTSRDLKNNGKQCFKYPKVLFYNLI